MFEYRLYWFFLFINWVEFVWNFKKFFRGNFVDVFGCRVEVYVFIVVDDFEGGCVVFRIVVYGYVFL